MLVIYLFSFPWPRILVSFYFLLWHYIIRVLLFPFQKPREPIPIEPYRSPALFSVGFFDTIIASSSMVLSTIRLPIQWCHPQVQHTYKRRRRQTSKPFKLMLLSLLAININTVPTVYSLPGTNHVLISNETSNDTSRQHVYAQTAIDNSVASHMTIDANEATSNNAADANKDELL
jgi:hypothetical protein